MQEGGRGSRHQEITMEKVYSEARARDRIEPRGVRTVLKKRFSAAPKKTFFSLSAGNVRGESSVSGFPPFFHGSSRRLLSSLFGSKVAARVSTLTSLAQHPLWPSTLPQQFSVADEDHDDDDDAGRRRAATLESECMYRQDSTNPSLHNSQQPPMAT